MAQPCCWLPGLRHPERDQAAGRARRGDGGQRALADEVVARHADGGSVEPGAHGVDGLVQLAAVPGQARLGAQRVARRHAARRDAVGRARGEQRLPQPRRVDHRHDQLVARLSGVARGADRRLDAGDLQPDHAVVRRQPRLGREPGEDPPRRGALEGDHARGIGEVPDAHVETGGSRVEVREVLRVVRRVDHEEPARVVAVHEDVIENARVFTQEHRVVGAPGTEPRDVPRLHPLEERRRLAAVDEEPTQVADVEEPRRGPHALVFLALPRRVLLGHLPAVGGGHPAAVGRVPAVQGGASQFRVVHDRLSAEKKNGDGMRRPSVPSVFCLRVFPATRGLSIVAEVAPSAARGGGGLRAARAPDALQSAVPARSFCLRDCGRPACRAVPCTFGDSRASARARPPAGCPRILSRCSSSGNRAGVYPPPGAAVKSAISPKGRNREGGSHAQRAEPVVTRSSSSGRRRS